MSIRALSGRAYSEGMKTLISILLSIALAPFILAEESYLHEGRGHDIGLCKVVNPIWWLGNEDRPFDEEFTFFGKIIDDSYKHGTRKFLFAVRNPGHNFTHYVIGHANHKFMRTGDYPSHVWSQDESKPTNICWIKKHPDNKGKLFARPIIPKPYLSRKGKVTEGYAGWRNGGNFGLALRKKQKVR